MQRCFSNGQKISQPHYSPPFWDDIRIPATSTNLGGSKDPTFSKVIDDGAGSQGVFSWLFSENIEEELYFSVQIPHRWQEGTPLKPHVHWFPTNTDAGSVRWGLEYSFATPFSVFPPTTIDHVVQAAGGTSLTHRIAGFNDIVMTGSKISTMILCRIFRNATDASDTYNTKAGLLEIDFHFQLDSPGSKQEFVK